MSVSPVASNEPVALDAALLWRDDVLAVRHLAERGEITAGDGRSALGPIARPGFAFARLRAGVATVTIPADATALVRRADDGHEIIYGPAEARLRRGDVLDLPIGELTLRAAAVAPLSLVLDAPGGPRARGVLLHVGLAAAAHFVVLGLSLQAALACDPDQEDAERAEDLRALIVHDEAADRARVDVPATDSGEGRAQGSTQSARAGDGRAGGGDRASSVEGKLGDRDAQSAKHGRYAVPERVKRDSSPALAREEALSDAAQFGMIGLLGQGPSVPVSAAWTADFEAHGDDAFAARGEMWAREMGASRGESGLGLSGTGEGGGGLGEGIGLGKIGTLGHLAGADGAGIGGNGKHQGGGGGRGRWLSAPHRTKWPSYRGGGYGHGEGWWWGHLPPEAIQRIVRQNFGRFRLCYENGLRNSPSLAGRVSVRFVIGRDGSVSSVANGGSDLPDAGVVQCVVRAFYGLSFPQPEGGIVTVTYPIVFSAQE